MCQRGVYRIEKQLISSVVKFGDIVGNNCTANPLMLPGDGTLGEDLLARAMPGEVQILAYQNAEAALTSGVTTMRDVSSWKCRSGGASILQKYIEGWP